MASSAAEGNLDPVLPLLVLRCHFTAETAITLPAYAGSAWRGVFGHALRQTVCVTGQRHCEGCALYHGCSYVYLFQTAVPPSSDRMRRYTTAPHPLVLAPPGHAVGAAGQPRQIAAGQTFMLAVHLFGKGAGQLPYVVQALRRAGQNGIGAAQGRFRLHAMDEWHFFTATWQPVWRAGQALPAAKARRPAIPPQAGEVALELLTPLRLKAGGRLVGPKKFAFHHLFRNLMRRIAMLHYFHDGRDLKCDFRTLADKSRGIEVSVTELVWKEWRRYSSRQRQHLEMGGLLGRITLPQLPADLWPWIWLGQYTHAGAGTSMGLGGYRLMASLPTTTAPAHKATMPGEH